MTKITTFTIIGGILITLLAVLVFIGQRGCEPISKPIHQLTLRLQLAPGAGEISLPLPIKVSVFSLKQNGMPGKLISEMSVSRDPNNSQIGIVTFVLPEGDYRCKAICSSFPVEGYTDVSLKRNTIAQMTLFLIEAH